jgi:hypothetical protein
MLGQGAARFNQRAANADAATLENFAVQQQANWQALWQAQQDANFATLQTKLKAVDRMYRSG